MKRKSKLIKKENLNGKISCNHLGDAKDIIYIIFGYATI